MALSAVKTFSAGEVLTASDLNAMNTNILNNGVDLWSPATKAVDFNGFEAVMDGDADSSLTADTDDRLDVRLGGVDLFRFDGTTASSVNGFDFVGTVASSAPQLKAQGSDTNIGVRLLPKGTGISNVVNGAYGRPGGRLTLTSGTAVTSSDVTAATTLYYTPYISDLLFLFDGTDKWDWYRFTELSIAVPATTSTMYDVWIYLNSGSPALELLAWTNDTSRATAIALQNGVYVKSGVSTRLYVGNMRTTGSSGQTEDSLAKRYIWNYYNRVVRPMKVTDATNTWNYSTASYRQANNSTANQLDFVVGVNEGAVTAQLYALVLNSTSTAREVSVAIGLDSTSASSSIHPSTAATNASNTACSAGYVGFPGIGRHFLAWIEQGSGTDTQTWTGTQTERKSGIYGHLMG